MKSKFERDTVGRIRLHVLPTDRFKTFAICVFIGQPLNEQSVTPHALTPFVLRRGTQRFPETKSFREKLDDMYGAGFGFDVFKRGDYQMIQFRMDMIDDKFISQSGNHLEQAMQFMGEAITRPLVEAGAFRTKYVESEKNTLRKKLEAIVNDKIRYAAERCIEEMCRDEPYRLHPLGRIQDLNGITSESLYTHYREWLNRAPVDIYVVGNTSLQQVKHYVAAFFSAGGSNPGEYRMSAANPEVSQVRTVVERMDVNQGKLNMGLRTYVTYADDKYPEALMYNGIVGGYPHSKLFINVREKASLAYYASSRLDGHKGIMTIQSGIEFDHYDKAVDIIKRQLLAMEDGQISELELMQTRAMIANQLREIQDSAFEMISFDFNSVLSGRIRDTAELIQAVEQVDPAAIRDMAGQVKLDTIYYLRDGKEG